MALLFFFSPVHAVSMQDGRKQPPRDSVQTATDTSYNYGISLRTNLLWWGAAEPNLSVDDLRQVINVIDTVEDVNQRENKIRSLAGGRIWKVLLPTVLHDQRNSGYVRIYFDYVPDEGARAINDAISDFETGNLQSAIEKLEHLRGDNRSDQAYATALLSAGREAEAVEVLEAAAARGDKGCKALLADWKKYSAARNAYEQYLREIEDYK